MAIFIIFGEKQFATQKVRQTLSSHFIKEHFLKQQNSVSATSGKFVPEPFVLQGDISRYLKATRRVARGKGLFQSVMTLKSYNDREMFQHCLDNQL